MTSVERSQELFTQLTLQGWMSYQEAAAGILPTVFHTQGEFHCWFCRLWGLSDLMRAYGARYRRKCFLQVLEAMHATILEFFTLLCLKT